MKKEIIFNPDGLIDEFLVNDAINENNSEILNSEGANYYNKGEYKTAKIYYELASAMGNDTAMSNLGYIYMYGRDVQIDYTIAFAFFRLSAEKGNIEATYKLGNLYQSGKGVEKNIELALEYYDKALKLIDDKGVKKEDYPSIYLTLAKEMMPNGNREQDLKKAYEYLKIALKGYNHLIEDEGADYYKKTYEETKKMLELDIFNGYE